MLLLKALEDLELNLSKLLPYDCVKLCSWLFIHSVRTFMSMTSV